MRPREGVLLYDVRNVRQDPCMPGYGWFVGRPRSRPQVWLVLTWRDGCRTAASLCNAESLCPLRPADISITD